MPELPEVETIARGLRHVLPGSTFACVTVEWRPMVQRSPLDLVERLPGQRVEQVCRRGKYLVFALDSGDALLIHLKMSGRLYVCPSSDAPNPYDRITFHLCDGRQMRFRDPRKFGRAYLTADAASMLSHLGPEPLDDAFGEGDFLARFDGRRGLIKPLLLDQTFVAGVGNIYADEALFLARVRPDRRVVTLSETDRRALYIGLRSVLNKGIELNGATLADGVFHGGSFQNSFCVYSRACGTMPDVWNAYRAHQTGAAVSPLLPQLPDVAYSRRKAPVEQLGAMEPDQLLQLLGGVVGCAITMFVLTMVYIILARRSRRAHVDGAELSLRLAGGDSVTLGTSVPDGWSLADASTSAMKPAPLDVGARLAGTGRDAWQPQDAEIASETPLRNGQEILRVVMDISSDRVWIKVAGVRYAHLGEVRDRSVGERILAATTWALKFSNGRAASDKGVVTIDLPDCDAVAVPAAFGALSDDEEQGELLRLVGDASHSEFWVQVAGGRYQALSQIADGAAGQAVLDGISHLLRFSHGRLCANDGVRVVPVPLLSPRPHTLVTPAAKRTVTPEEEEAFLRQMRSQLEDTGSQRTRRSKPTGEGRGTGKVAKNAPRSFSLVDEIDGIFQRRLQASPLAQVDAQFVERPDGSVRIRVGAQFFDRPDEVPDADLRKIMEAAIAEW